MIDYTVIRSRRRTLALEVTRQGTALVRAPLRASDADITRFVDSHRGWLEKHLAARQAYLAAHPEPSAAQSGRMAAAGKRDTAAPGGPLGPAHGRAARRYHHHRRPHPLRQLLRQKPSQLLPLPDGLSREPPLNTWWSMSWRTFATTTTPPPSTARWKAICPTGGRAAPSFAGNSAILRRTFDTSPPPVQSGGGFLVIFTRKPPPFLCVSAKIQRSN